MTYKQLIDIVKYNNFIFPNQEIVVLTYNMDEIKPKEIMEITKYIQSTFPDQKCIALPSEVSIHSVPKQTIQNIIEYLTSLIDDNK